MTHLLRRLIPETKGRSIEEMDIIFGSVTQEKRDADVANLEQRAGSSNPSFSLHVSC